MTSLSRATRWRAGSRRASLTPPSGARWSIQAPKPRVLASMSRSPNELSSPTSPCESRSIQPSSLSEGTGGLTLRFCCRNVNGITFVGSVKEKTVARNLYAQARARGKAAGIVRYQTAAGFQASAERSSTTVMNCFCFTGPTHRTWRPLRPRSMFHLEVTSSLSSTTRR